MSVPEPALTQSLTEPPISAGIGYIDARADRRSAVGLRSWVLTAMLFLVPLVTYWPATFHDYGLRDDYSNLREAHEEPGKVLMFCASHARPIYGWLLQSTYGQTASVQNLQWMRLIASLLLGAISLVMYRGLRGLGWPQGTSLCVTMLLALVPSAQVIASWALGWPYAAAALLAIGGFFTLEGSLGMGWRPGGGRAVRQSVVGFSLLVVSALIYQPSTLFYAVPLAGALIAHRQRGFAATVRWLGVHFGFVAAALGLAYCTMAALYSMGIFIKSGRVAFEHHWLDKIVWFVQEPLPNALSMFVLNDNNHRDHLLYCLCAALVALILVAGGYLEWRRHGRARGLVWVTGLITLPLFACAMSLVASERYATYRTILALTAVLLCFLVTSVHTMTEHWNASTRRLLATLLVACAFFTAQHHAYALIAVPQGNEWQLILEGAQRVHLAGGTRPRIFAIASTPADISTATIYHDEFGSLSSNSEWVPREMFKRAMHDLHPEIANIDARYDFATGPKLLPGQHYDVIIDMHRLRHFYTEN
jgi:hypothetical protein